MKKYKYSTPFFHWSGGKTWFYKKFKLLIPKYERYIDPFFGSGAFFFWLSPQKSIINDIDSNLIKMYEVLRDSPYLLVDILKDHKKKHNKAYYYYMINCKLSNKIEAAAQLIYIISCSFNGIYKLNKDGTYKPLYSNKMQIRDKLIDLNHMLKLSRQLKIANIYNYDYTKIISMANKNDLLFVDPPYGIEEYKAVDYGRVIFNIKDQINLSRLLKRALKKGVKIISTNGATDDLVSLYKDDFNILYVSRLTGYSNKKDPDDKSYMKTIITGNI